MAAFDPYVTRSYSGMGAAKKGGINMSATVADRRIENVPQPIVDALRGLISRVRLVMLVRGLLAVAAIAIACLLIGMAIDAAFTIFSTGGRVALSLTLLAVVLAGAWWYLIRPLARTFTLSGMARIIEERHPVWKSD